MKISLVHDMAESTVGDLTPHCGVSEEDKHKQEVAAMEHFITLVGEKAGNEMFNLFMVFINAVVMRIYYVVSFYAKYNLYMNVCSLSMKGILWMFCHGPISQESMLSPHSFIYLLARPSVA